MASSPGDEYSDAGYLAAWAALTGGDAPVFADLHGREVEAYLNNPLRNISAASLSVSGGVTIAGVFLGADGSAAAPSLSFTSDTNTGMYRVAADQIGFSTGGVLRARFWSGGLLMSTATGAGNMPTGAGTAAAPSYSFYGDTNTGMYRKAADTIGFSTAGADLFRMDASYLRGNVNYTPSMPGKAAGSAAAPAYSFVNDTNTGMYRYSADRIGFAAGGAWRMLVSSSEILCGVDIRQDSGDAAAVILQSNTNTVGSLSKWVEIRNNSGTRQGWTGMYNGNMYLWADVGAVLTHAGGASTSFMDGTNVYIYDAYNNASTGGSYVRIDSSGLLHRYSSSRKTKTDFEPLTDEFADKVLDIEPVFFRSKAWNDNPNYSYYGAVAEDVAEIDPRFAEWGPPLEGCACPDAQERGATWDDHEDDCFVPVSIGYGTFTMHLIQIAKRQRDTIGALDERLNILEKKV